MIAKMNQIMFIFHLDWLKTFALWLIPSLSGWTAAFLFQVPPSHWYEQPAVIAGAVSGGVAIIALLLNRHFQKKDKAKDDEKEKNNQHITFSEKMQEHAQNLSQAAYTELEKVHHKEIQILNSQSDKEIGFWKREYSLKSRSDFESRMRAHIAVNENNNLKLHIFILQKLLNDAKITFPEIKLKSEDDLASEVATRMLDFKDDLIERYEKAMRE